MSAVIVQLSVALFVVVTVLRLAVSNPIEAVGAFSTSYRSACSPASAGRGALYGAAGAVGLTIVWAVVQHVPLGVIGYCSRAATFASVGILVGFQAEQRRKLEQERERLCGNSAPRRLATPSPGSRTAAPGTSDLNTRPVHEMLDGGPIKIPYPDLAMEVRQREVDQQPTVLAARAGAHAVAATARVAIEPRQAELVQGRAAPPRTRLAVALQLDRASVGHRVGRLLALVAVDATDTTNFDPRR